ncbi:MAG TPA: hypothetical protein VHB79_02065 [Polyangiaceae bacterium]|nr:hypothetical protein [Polyangiaceae bacterium]
MQQYSTEGDFLYEIDFSKTLPTLRDGHFISVAWATDGLWIGRDSSTFLQQAHARGEHVLTVLPMPPTPAPHATL